MRKTCCFLILGLLFISSSCSFNSDSEVYKWIPPEKKIAQTAADDGYDPASGLTYEEYLTTIDSPIVVSIERLIRSTPLLESELTRDPAAAYIKALRNNPHVTNVSLPVLFHWLDNFCGESILQAPADKMINRNSILLKDVTYAPMEKATLMIGQYQTALTDEQIGEGRKWEDMRECCVNRALYEKLLAAEKAEFKGLGDIISVTESFYMRGFMHDTGEEAITVCGDFTTTTHEYTVVGIVEEEEEYANTEAYGLYHIYVSIDMLRNLIAKHDNNHPNYVDNAMY